MESETNPLLIGRRITDIATETGADPFDLLLDLALQEPGLALRVKAMLANDDQDGVAVLLKTEGCTLGLSDAGAHIGQLCDAVLPTDLLGTWVRDKQVLTLEEAVHKLTKVQADLFRFEDRGVLKPGAFADIVVFDPDTVAPGPIRRVRDFPADGERLTADQPQGMSHLFVNGVEVVRYGSLVDESLQLRPGTLVSPGRR
jgi:N-acyl-D-aspartate/D-glutamate deacylase